MKAINKILFFIFTACAALCGVGSASAVPVSKIDTTIIDTFICKSAVYQFGDETISETGTYTKTFTTAAGLDSTVVLYLSVEDCNESFEDGEPEAKEKKSNLNCDKVIAPHSSFGAGSDVREAVWIIDNIEKYNNVVAIYDRWGNLVYQKKNYTNAEGWDGTCRGSELSSNDYWYAITLNDLGRICYGHFSFKKK